MRFFYAVLVEDRVLEQILNAVRVLCNPEEKHTAHITVRGPYHQRYNLDAQSRTIEGALVEVDDVGCFWGERQNTVYLACHAPELEKIWHKPDYPDYNPHITVYDGASRDFAEAVQNCLQRCVPHFFFRASPLYPIISSKGQRTMDLLASLDTGLLSRLLSEPIGISEITTMGINRRVKLISKLCDYLHAPDIPHSQINPGKRASYRAKRTGSDSAWNPAEQLSLVESSSLLYWSAVCNSLPSPNARFETAP